MLPVDIDPILQALNKLAAELLEKAEALSGPIENTAEAAEKIRAVLDGACDALSTVHKLLSGSGSPLPEIERRMGGTLHAAPLVRLREFLDEHRDAIRAVTLNSRRVEGTIDRLLALLNEDVDRGGQHELDKGELWEGSGPVLGTIAEFRDLVCEVAHDPNLGAILASPQLPSAIVSGMIGTAVVIVDVTGAAAVAPHDWTGWTLVRAVKSVWSGISRIRPAVSTIRETLVSIKKSRTTDESIADIKKRFPPKPPFGQPPGPA
jgi:hypothetical protein